MTSMLNSILKKIDSDFLRKIITIESPAIIYNFNIINEVIDKLYNRIGSRSEYLKIFYSVKANSNTSLLHFLSNKIDGADVASLYELNKAMKAGFNSLSVTSPGFSNEEIKQVYDSNNIFDFNSLSQLKDSYDIIKGKEIGVRIKSQFTNLDTNRFDKTMGSRFGIDFADKEFVKFVTKNNIIISRIHIHNGEKDSNDLETIFSIVKEILNNPLFNEIKQINLGGGFVQSFVRHGMDDFLTVFDKFYSEHKTRMNNIFFVIEPGRLISNLSGFLISKVKTADYDSREQVKNVVMDASAYNLFQWFLPRPITTTSKYEKIRLNIWGNTCYERDCFAFGLCFNNLNIGDKVVFYPVGAYSKNNSKSLHEIPFPQEYVYENNEIRKLE
ncbi:hypothetical protein GWJ21_15245 [Bacillus coagulans]|nr:hypothetical protein [Heyndrickxia coagulans]